MTKVVITQAMLFPWSGFFEQLAMADVYLYLDDTQFSKGSLTNRIQIKLGGAVRWMTIPLVGKGSFQTIADLNAVEGDWRQSHRTLLHQALSKAPFFEDALALFDKAYSKPEIYDLLIESIEGPAGYLGIGVHRRIEHTSNLGVKGRSSQRVQDIVLKSGGTHYITGHGAAGYLDHAAFEDAGVCVEYMDYGKLPYSQGEGAFTPYVSILDLIARCGPESGKYLAAKTIQWRDFVKERSAALSTIENT